MSDESMMENEQPSGGRRYLARPKICQFCADKNIVMDYKNIDLVRRFVTEEGKIRPRRQTGTCARHQRELARTVKRARHIALVPYVAESPTDNMR